MVLSGVEARFHRQIQSDLNRVLEEYFSISHALGDDFYEEFMTGLRQAISEPHFLHFALDK